MDCPYKDYGCWIKNPDELFQELYEYPWKQEQLKMFGKTIPEPRLVMWYGNTEYKYTGKVNSPTPMTPLLKDLADKLEEFLTDDLQQPVKFNSVFCNLYQDGSKYIGWHADNEKGLDPDPEPVIASISLGATRDFQLRHNSTKETCTIPLHSGNLLVMYGNCQKDYKHQVPKRLKVKEPRINLTFRWFCK